MKVSIFELVVGDIVQLNIGDQVSTAEVFLKAYYHFVTESSDFSCFFVKRCKLYVQNCSSYSIKTCSG